MHEPFLGMPAVGECPIYIFPMFLWAFICSAGLAVLLCMVDRRQSPLKSRTTLGWLAAIFVIALTSQTAFRVIPPRYPVLGFLFVIIGSLLAAYAAVRLSGNWTRTRFVGASVIILAELLVVYGMGNGAVWLQDRIHVVTCENRLKVINAAIGEYRAAHDGSFPPSAGWPNSIKQYIGRRQHVPGRMSADRWLICGSSVKATTHPVPHESTYAYHKPPAHSPGDFPMVTCDHPAGIVLPAQRIVLQENGKVRCNRIGTPGKQ